MKEIYNVDSISKIYKIIKANYNFNINEFKIIKSSVSLFNNFKNELLSSSNKYLNYEFAYKYLQQCSNCYHITYNDLNMYVIMRGKLTKRMKIQLFKNVYRVYLISKIYDISKNGNYIFNYYIIMNPKRRYMPAKKDELIDVININGGFTYTDKNNIYIIRKEDYNKVILHELLHHNLLIHKDDWKETNIKRLKEHFNIDEKMRLIPNEAIIETYACILNTIFHSIETGTSFKDNLKKDQEYSIYLTKKILEKQGRKKWIENTHSYCYIVFKTILYVYFNKFLKIYKYHNDTEITNFLINYSHKIYDRINKINKNKHDYPKNNKLKQTIY
jgi:hypothetical protein